jgi:hypothetical protein
MAQYAEGTVDVTNNSNVVPLIDGDSTQVQAGDWFIVRKDEAVNGSGVIYEIAATPVDPDEDLQLTIPWAGDTVQGQLYTAHRDFDGNGIPILTPSDVEFTVLINRQVLMLTNLIAQGGGPLALGPGDIRGEHIRGEQLIVTVSGPVDTPLTAIAVDAPRYITFKAGLQTGGAHSVVVTEQIFGEQREYILTNSTNSEIHLYTSGDIPGGATWEPGTGNPIGFLPPRTAAIISTTSAVATAYRQTMGAWQLWNDQGEGSKSIADADLTGGVYTVQATDPPIIVVSAAGITQATTIRFPTSAAGKEPFHSRQAFVVMNANASHATTVDGFNSDGLGAMTLPVATATID